MTKFNVSTQTTSNPLILKFVADTFLVNYNSFEYNNIDEATNSPLAQQLFYLPFVKKVYISGNFVAIERYNIVEWEDVLSKKKNSNLNLCRKYTKPICIEICLQQKACEFFLRI